MARTFLALLLTGAIVYAGLCLVTYLRQRQLMYFPTPPSVAENVESLWLDSAGERLKLWVVGPGHRDAIVYFGGNAEDVLYARELFEAVLPSRTVYLVNYRGYGGSSGSPTEAGFDTDALNVFDAVVARHGSVAVVGRSIGSAVALHVAARRPVARLVLVTPMDSMETLARRLYPLLPVSLLMKDRYRAVDDARHVTAPTLVVAAGEDEIVPADSTRTLVEALDRASVETRILEGETHNSLGSTPRYAEALESFLLAGQD